MSLYKKCLLCPRRCGVDREAGQMGYCGETAELRLAFAGIHKGEEPAVSGKGGSGTVFVSGCNLGCAFCQNYQISLGEPAFNGKNASRGIGRSVSSGEFASICLALQEKGAANINIVTGSHAAPALARGVEAARNSGLSIPVLWNSSGYEGAETLELLKDFVDVYLPDLKTLDSALASAFFKAPDYPLHAARAILAMTEYRRLCFAPAPGGAEEMLASGVMVRHLVIPGYLEATRKVLRWFAENCAGGGNRALLSLMTQYTPVEAAGKSPAQKSAAGAAVPGRFLSEREYETLLSMLDEFGIDNGFCQELVNDSEWLPDFRRRNPFSSELSVPVWHWRDGLQDADNLS